MIGSRVEDMRSFIMHTSALYQRLPLPPTLRRQRGPRSVATKIANDRNAVRRLLCFRSRVGKLSTSLAAHRYDCTSGRVKQCKVHASDRAIDHTRMSRHRDGTPVLRCPCVCVYRDDVQILARRQDVDELCGVRRVSVRIAR